MEPFRSKWQKEKGNLCAGTPPRRRMGSSNLRLPPTPTRHSRMRKEDAWSKGHAIRQKAQAHSAKAQPLASDSSASASRLLFISPAPSDDRKDCRMGPIVRCYRSLSRDDQRVGSVHDSATVMDGARDGECVDENDGGELARVVESVKIGALPSSGTVCYEARQAMKVANDKTGHTVYSSRIGRNALSQPECVNKVASRALPTSRIHHLGRSLFSHKKLVDCNEKQ